MQMPSDALKTRQNKVLTPITGEVPFGELEPSAGSKLSTSVELLPWVDDKLSTSGENLPATHGELSPLVESQPCVIGSIPTSGDCMNQPKKWN